MKHIIKNNKILPYIDKNQNIECHPKYSVSNPPIIDPIISPKCDPKKSLLYASPLSKKKLD